LLEFVRPPPDAITPATAWCAFGAPHARKRAPTREPVDGGRLSLWRGWRAWWFAREAGEPDGRRG